MRIRVLYFASLREAVGTGHEELAVPAGITTVGALRAWLRDRGAPWADALSDARAVRIAVDQSMADARSALHDGAEVAFFPPVTGG